MKKILFAVFGLLTLMAFSSVALGETQTLTFTFAGDCTLGCNYGWEDDWRAFPNVVEPEGYDYPFREVQSLFATDDLTVVNLEGVLKDDTSGRASGRKYNFYGKTDYTGILLAGSVEAVGLGNNHMHDYGEAGVESTKAALDAAGIGWALDDDAYIFEKNGIRVAFLSYLQDAFFARMDNMEEIVRELKEDKGCSAVVMLLHIGTEYADKHNRSQLRSAHIAIDAGVDLVMECHAHVIQGCHIYKNRNVVYSMGNFSFGGSRNIKSAQTPSVVVRVTMDFDEDGTYLGQQMTLWPARNTSGKGYNNYQPYLVDGEDAAKILKKMQQDTDYHLEAFVDGQGAVQKYLPAEE